MTNKAKEPKRYYAISNPDSDPSMIAIVQSGANMRSRFLTALKEHYNFEDIRPQPMFNESEVIRNGTTQAVVNVFEDDHHFEMELTIKQTWLY